MIVNRTFITEVVRTMLAVTLVIISIFLVTRVMGFLGMAADGVIPIDGVLTLVGLKMVGYLDVMLPLMFYIALIMVLNRWYGDNEIAVLASAGLGITHFLKPLGWLMLFVGGLVAFFSFFLTPLSIAKGYTLEKEYRSHNEVFGVVTGQFVEAKGGNGVYFVEKFNRKLGRYENVFVYRASFKREGVVVAKTAYRIEEPKTKDQFLVLENGTRYEGNPGSPDYRVVDFSRYALRIEPKARAKLYLPLRAKPNSELMHSEHSQARSEWYWRIAKAFTLPILAIFALALCHVDARRGKAKGIVLAFVVYLSYTNLLGYATALIKSNVFASGLPIWLVHGFYFLLAVYALYKRSQNQPFFPRFSKKYT